MFGRNEESNDQYDNDNQTPDGGASIDPAVARAQKASVINGVVITLGVIVSIAIAVSAGAVTIRRRMQETGEGIWDVWNDLRNQVRERLREMRS